MSLYDERKKRIMQALELILTKAYDKGFKDGYENKHNTKLSEKDMRDMIDSYIAEHGVTQIETLTKPDQYQTGLKRNE